MGDLPRVRVMLTDFPGLLSKQDPDDLPPGAATVQTNLTSNTPGALRVRPGLRELIFEDA